MQQNQESNRIELLSSKLVTAGWGICALLLVMLVSSGCRSKPLDLSKSNDVPDDTQFLKIEYPRLCDESCDVTDEFETGKPPTISDWRELEKWGLTLDEAIQMALANSKVLQKLGGRVLSAPAGTATIYDPALTATNSFASSEAALSAFDAQVATSLFVDHQERKFNNAIQSSFGGTKSDTGVFNFDLSKTTAAGTRLSARNITNYQRFDSPFNRFNSTWDTVNLLEVRQPLWQGYGTAINRIAGPNATPGNYNGVLIARIREDVSVLDFETAIRDLIRDTETAYWDLYFAYRNLDALLAGREFARKTWENRKKRVDRGIARRDEEAQARQQYFAFQTRINDLLMGRGPLTGSAGVFSAERQLRRLLGLLNNDGRIIRPTTEPTIAAVRLDWDQAQASATNDRVELRRQKWAVRQRELEYFAACQLNRWRLDLIANYGWRGFGDNLFGSRDRPEGSAVEDLFSGDLDDWRVGFEMSGAIGKRTGHLALRNAQLQLAREKALLREQQRQVLLDLNAAYSEIDRSFEVIKSSFNNRLAVLEELELKRKRAEAGEEDTFFLLEVQQRATTAEIELDQAITDYNKSLLNFAYTSGELLEQYNIFLAEGPWGEAAEAQALENSMQFLPARLQRKRDVMPLTK
jgi:outer membrane protein TolC